MFNLASCVYEIYAVCEYKRKGDYPECDIGTAASMFLADVKHGTNENTGDALPGFDFAAASSAWNAMTDEEQTAALEAASKSRTALYAQLSNIYPNKEAMVKLVEDYLSPDVTD